jgi:hypothetical protein
MKIDPAPPAPISFFCCVSLRDPWPLELWLPRTPCPCPKLILPFLETHSTKGNRTRVLGKDSKDVLILVG